MFFMDGVLWVVYILLWFPFRRVSER